MIYFTTRLAFVTPGAQALIPLVTVSAGEVQGRIDLDVYSEVLGPFKIIPRGVLEAGGNSVMGALVNNLLPLFLRRCVVVHVYTGWRPCFVQWLVCLHGYDQDLCTAVSTPDNNGCRLVLDYERWATDDAYRQKRAQRADSNALRK